MCFICVRPYDIKLVQCVISMSSFTLVIVHIYIYGSINTLLFTTFSPLYFFCSTIYIYIYMRVILCFRAKFYRLLVVSFMGWNSVQVRGVQTFLFSCPRIVLYMLVRRMAWVARTLFLSLSLPFALLQAIRRTTTPHQLTHQTEWRKGRKKMRTMVVQRKCHFHFFFFSVGRVPSTVQ